MSRLYWQSPCSRCFEDAPPATTGELGMLAGARLYDEAAARRDDERAEALDVWRDKQEATR